MSPGRRPAGTGRGLVWMCALAVPLAGCNKGPTPFEVIEEVTFASSLGIDLAAMTKLPSGVYIRDDVVGTGAILAADDTATIVHTGWLRTGEPFSQGTFNVIYLSPLAPTLQYATDLIDGVEIGMEGMAEGGTRTMVIPPGLAYGNNPPPSSFIPEGAILVFEWEITQIRSGP